MTIKQKLAAKKIAENHGNVSKAMLEVGYSPNTAKKPSNLTESKGWQELMEKYLPDNEILKTHQEALQANKVISAKILGKEANEQTDDFIEVPDHPTRLKAVELGYKVKGRLKESGINVYGDKVIAILGGESYVSGNNSNQETT